MYEAKNGYVAPPDNAHIYEAYLKDLAPGRSVCYQVVQGDVKSTPTLFSTTPKKSNKFRFVAYGDTRTQPEVHTTLSKQILEANPKFVIHSGDITLFGTIYPLWKEDFFRPLENVIDHIPLWPCVGNHERDGVNYRNFYNLPGDELNYSFDYGSAHFVSIDNILTSLEEICDWLDKDLAKSKAKWKFVYYHIPTYNSHGHASDWGQGVIDKILRKHKVDVVFNGHSHLYECSCPIVSAYDENKWPVLHIVTGGGGASLADIKIQREFTDKFSKEHHIIIVDIDEKVFTAKVINDKGEIIDTFSIDKTNGHTKEFLADAIDEEFVSCVSEIHSTLDTELTPCKAGEPQSIDLKFTNKALLTSKTITIRAIKHPVFEKVDPKLISCEIGAGKERVVNFSFTPTLDLDKEELNKDGEKLRAKMQEVPELYRKRLFSMVLFEVECKTSLGDVKFEYPGLNLRVGKPKKKPVTEAPTQNKSEPIEKAK